jgi:hypothetical protein
MTIGGYNLNSKTLGFNVAVLVALVAAYYAGAPVDLTEAGDTLTAIVAVVNIILRFATKEPLKQ